MHDRGYTSCGQRNHARWNYSMCLHFPAVSMISSLIVTLHALFYTCGIHEYSATSINKHTEVTHWTPTAHCSVKSRSSAALALVSRGGTKLRAWHWLTSTITPRQLTFHFNSSLTVIRRVALTERSGSLTASLAYTRLPSVVVSANSTHPTGRACLLRCASGMPSLHIG